MAASSACSASSSLGRAMAHGKVLLNEQSITFDGHARQALLITWIGARWPAEWPVSGSPTWRSDDCHGSTRAIGPRPGQTAGTSGERSSVPGTANGKDAPMADAQAKWCIARKRTSTLAMFHQQPFPRFNAGLRAPACDSATHGNTLSLEMFDRAVTLAFLLFCLTHRKRLTLGRRTGQEPVVRPVMLSAGPIRSIG
jgi:hypothetical protein